MNASEIRQAYIDFFKDKGHQLVSRASLMPENDATTLFTGSGMQPLLPYLLGDNHPMGGRLVNSQTCFRAQDIDDIGDNRHTTFFEMLGNWSLGEYSKRQQIEWFFEFLTEIVGLDPNKLYVSVFIGDKKHGIPRDEEAVKIWQDVFEKAGVEAKVAEIGAREAGDKRGINPGERIFYYDDGENWWSRNGGIASTPIGDPCGPDSEVFYDFGDMNHDESFGLAHPASDSGRFMEIGNQVFMQYRREADGSFSPLKKQNIDFGGGLERIAAAKLDNPDVFMVSLIKPIIDKLEELSQKSYSANTSTMRVIADHLRAASFLVVDGVLPSNKSQGYVLRRLIRRAIRLAFDLGLEQNFITEIVPVITDIYKDDYPIMEQKKQDVVQALAKEEKVFRQTLRKGLKMLDKLKADGLTGKEVFTLYDTYGFPVELSTEEAFRQGIKLSDSWRDEFDREMDQQRQRSQTATKGTFKGGLADDNQLTVKYHTLAHLLMQALRQVLGDHASQKGSNITPERLRLDFSHPEKVTPEQIEQIETIVNQKISENLEVKCRELSLEEARNEGAMGVFDNKYGDKVKVYSIGGFSKEICGGPHIEHTGELAEGGKKFKIVKEESSSAGVRRIKAILK